MSSTFNVQHFAEHVEVFGEWRKACKIQSLRYNGCVMDINTEAGSYATYSHVSSCCYSLQDKTDVVLWLARAYEVGFHSTYNLFVSFESKLQEALGSFDYDMSKRSIYLGAFDTMFNRGAKFGERFLD